jgi:mono/diheme cytochrome c family protein
MTATHTRTKFLTAVVGAVVATMAAPALLLLSAGTAQAVIHYIPTPRDCAGCHGFDPQPDLPDDPDLRPPLTRDPGSTVGIIIDGGAPSPSLNPGDTAGVVIIGG